MTGINHGSTASDCGPELSQPVGQASGSLFGKARQHNGLASGWSRLILAPAMALLMATSMAACAETGDVAGRSPALCGPNDNPEPGIQGDVPAGATPDYHCGLSVVGQLPIGGTLQGTGHCAYVRSGGEVHVVDVSDPAQPVQVKSIPVQSGSETMRAVINDERAVLVSGSSVYDISDCLDPVLVGEIPWPPLRMEGIPSRMLPHDIRVNHGGTKVYASFGLWQADISDLSDPSSWTVTDHRCELAAQQPGPWAEVHRVSLEAGMSLCADAQRPSPMGAGYLVAASPLQASLLWPTLSHGIDFRGDDQLLYTGDQAGGSSGVFAGPPKLRILDVARGSPRIIGEVDGPGHGVDWFRSGGRDYVLHSNEGGTGGILNQPSDSDTCVPHPRPTALGWGFEVVVSDVTEPDNARNVSMLRLAINEPEFCEERKASGHDPWISYHMVDNPLDASFAAVNFGRAGLRVFDIRDPANPSEVAYFNHGPLAHSGISHYDAERGLLYVPGGSSFWVLEVQPQVREHLGL